MALDRTVEYSIEQAVALLSGRISLQALNSNSSSVERYCANMFSSEEFWNNGSVNRYYQQILNALRQSELRAADHQVLVKIPSINDQHRTETITQQELSDEFELSAKTLISKSELRRWVAGKGEAHSFLMSHYEMSIARTDGWEAGKQAFLAAEGCGGDSTPRPVQVPDKTDEAPSSSVNLSLRIADIQALLDGTHEFQNDALRVELQVWLENIDHQNQSESNDLPPKGSSSGPDIAA